MVNVTQFYLRKGESQVAVGSKVVEPMIKFVVNGYMIFVKIECSRKFYKTQCKEIC